MDEKPKKPDIRDAFKNLQRNPATLGDITDFPSDWLEIPIRQIQIGVEKLHGTRRRLRFRSAGR